MKTKINSLFAVTTAVALLLSACAAEKRAPQNHAPPNRGDYLIADKMSTLEITAPAELGFMVKGACAGAACGLLAQVDNKTAPAPAQCPFPAPPAAPSTAAGREARPAPAGSSGGDVESEAVTEQVERTDAAAAGEYREPEARKGRLPGKLPE